MSDGKKVDEKKADEKEASTFMQVRDIFESLAIALFLGFLFKTLKLKPLSFLRVLYFNANGSAQRR